jgi:hypothetical protein
VIEHPAYPALAIFTRVPDAGPAKTRLAAEVGEARAESLARAFLLDTLRRVARLDVARSLWYTPPEARALLQRLVEARLPDLPVLETPPSGLQAAPQASLSNPARVGPGPARGLALVSQVAGPLDLRIETALRALLAQGHDRICVIGSDSPTLPRARFRQAYAALADADFALAPAHDGGFVLLGARTCPPGLLAGIAWSTGHTASQTRARLERHGSVAILEPWYDVDTLADLRRLSTDPGLAECPFTSELIAARVASS